MIWRFMMVCSGDAVGLCGAIVASGGDHENFIDVMVNIDGGDSWRRCRSSTAWNIGRAQGSID